MRYSVILLLLLSLALPCLAQSRPFAEGEVDNESPYAGQPVVYTLRIFSQTEMSSNSTIIEPNFFGFGRSSVALDPVSYADSIDGITYNIIEQSYIIYPIRTGELTIDPFQISIPETPFDPAMIIYVDAVTINVLPYPEPVPDSFSNAIGQFDVAVDVSPANLNSGDAITVNLTVSGTGNLEQILAPTLNLENSWRVLEQETDYQQDNLRFGSKIFRWTIVIEGNGLTEFPSIVFSYFNPQTGQYETRQTTPVALNITATTPQQEVTIERTPAPIQAVSVPELMQSYTPILPTTPPTWFWWLWIVPPLFTIMMWITGRQKQESERRAKPRKSSGSRALKKLQRSLQEAQSLTPKDGYPAIADAIYRYIGSKTGEIVTEDTISEIVSVFPEQYGNALLSCVEEAHSGQYAPVSEADVQQLSQRVLGVCAMIEKVEK